ncbi:uncharacterized protein O3C94_007131 [Discoglossus pictus]
MVRVFGVLNWPKKMSWHLFKRPNWCGLRISLTCLILITLCIVAPIIIWEEVTRPRGNQTQSIGEMWMNRMRRDMMEVNLTGQVTLVFKEGQIGTNQIDLCQVLRCGLSGGGRSGGVRKAPVYLCIASPYGNERCPSWKLALWNTGADWGYSPPNHMKCKSTKRRLKLTRGVEPSSCSQNQLCNPIRITLQDPQKCDEGRYTLGIYTSGRGNNMEYLHIQVLQKEEPRQTIDLTKVSPVNRTVPSQVIYLEPDRLIDTFEIETGYAEKNIWLEWMLYTAASMEMSNCIACSTARPSMATVPFKLNQQNDEKGLKCMLQLFQQIAPVSNCTALHYLYPPVSRIQPPQFMIYPGNFTCFNRTGQNSRISVGQAPYCSDIIHVGSKEYPDTLFSNHLVGRADIWWYCGGKQVRQVLPSLWGGICTLIQLAQPFYILPDRSAGMMWITEKNLKRARRSVPKGSFDDRIYIDSIGIPRGVPDEFKARNQVAAGFETIISWWVTINKNVDWINYIYYNQQRFVNYTRDAVQAVAPLDGIPLGQQMTNVGVNGIDGGGGGGSDGGMLGRFLGGGSIGSVHGADGSRGARGGVRGGGVDAHDDGSIGGAIGHNLSTCQKESSCFHSCSAQAQAL